MLKSIFVTNYKSIASMKLELGRVNVLIGANGAGKTNALEAIAFVAAVLNRKSDVEELVARGVRPAMPSMTFSAFADAKPVEAITCNLMASDLGAREIPLTIAVDAKNRLRNLWSQIHDPLMGVEDQEGWLKDLMEALVNASATISAREPETYAKTLTAITANAKTDGDRDASRELWRRIVDTKVLAASLDPFVIYEPNTLCLRGLETVSRRVPIGIHGEDLDVAFAGLSEVLRKQVVEKAHVIGWFKDAVVDPFDKKKREGKKQARSRSRLYFQDKYMAADNSEFSAENANEGILYLMFYLTMFVSPDTPKIFAIDNIETALNPQLCRGLMKELVVLAKEHDKQALITTHNPAVLDGLNLNDDEQRLFVVDRDDDGHTVARRIRAKPPSEGTPLKLSEMWMRGLIGGIPDRF